MDLMKIIGVAFVTAIAAVILRITKPELSFAVTVTGVIIILLFIVDMLQNSLTVFSSITQLTGLENGLVKLLLKIVGVGYLTEFSAGLLNDFGGSAVADKVTIAGKVLIFLLSLPVLENLLQLMQGFLQLV